MDVEFQVWYCKNPEKCTSLGKPVLSLYFEECSVHVLEFGNELGLLITWHTGELLKSVFKGAFSMALSSINFQTEDEE